MMLKIHFRLNVCVSTAINGQRSNVLIMLNNFANKTHKVALFADLGIYVQTLCSFNGLV